MGLREGSMEGIDIFNSFFCAFHCQEKCWRNEIPINKNTSHLFLSFTSQKFYKKKKKTNLQMNVKDCVLVSGWLFILSPNSFLLIDHTWPGCCYTTRRQLFTIRNLRWGSFFIEWPLHMTLIWTSWMIVYAVSFTLSIWARACRKNYLPLSFIYWINNHCNCTCPLVSDSWVRISRSVYATKSVCRWYRKKENFDQYTRFS